MSQMETEIETKIKFNLDDIVNKEFPFQEIKQLKDKFNLKIKYDENLYLLNSTEIDYNGIILEKDTNKIVCMCKKQFTIHTNQLFIEQNKDVGVLEYCEDGTVIRLYNYKGEWKTATTRCTDATKSFWSSSKTFDDLFYEIFNKEDFVNLDTDYTYIFVLIHNENRIVIKHSVNKLIYINKINNITRKEHFDKETLFENYLIENTQSASYQKELQFDKRGYILRIFDEKTNSWNYHQYDFPEYLEIKDIRGNVPLIRIRYLELLNNPDKLQMLEDYYQEHYMVFCMIKHCLCNLYKNVHITYIKSHVQHKITVTETDLFYKTLKQLHGQYKKTGNKITIEVVMQKINNLDVNIIKKLIGWVN